MMSPTDFKKYKVTKRPYPKDIERIFNVKAAMARHKIKSVSELAKRINIARVVLNEIINGTRRSPVNEARIARFFNMPVEALFPYRSKFDLAEMNKKEKECAGAA